jgi:hypothetical protein
MSATPNCGQTRRKPRHGCRVTTPAWPCPRTTVACSFANCWRGRRRGRGPAALLLRLRYNIRLGEGVFLNFNCVILDVVQVIIGSGTQIGPMVQIYAADHPEIRQRARAAPSSGVPSRSAKTCGSAAVPSCSQASRSACLRRGGGDRHPQRAEREDRRGQSCPAALKRGRTRNVEGLRALVRPINAYTVTRAGRRRDLAFPMTLTFERTRNASARKPIPARG